MEPITGYALLGDERIAYQVIGDGPVDLLIAPSWFSAFDIEWEEPSIRRFLERLASFVRVIRLDRRGSGASDPVRLDDLPPWEVYAEDVACVMDAVGSESCFLYADGDVGPIGLLFAATHPDRVRGLILFNTSARFLAGDDYPIGIPTEIADSYADLLSGDWGSGEQLDFYVPSRANDRDFQRWVGRLMRAVTTPSSVKAYMDGVMTADARGVLDSIEAPTLILHPSESQVPSIENGRYVAERIDDARFIEIPGPGDAYPYFALAEPILGAIQEFVTGAAPPETTERALATVLFTDIVDSTKRAEQLGDRQWTSLLDFHDGITRTKVEENSGHLVDFTGDGLLATFDGPGRAIRCATAIQHELAVADLHIRSGIHTGEVEIRDRTIAGIAVHLAARIMALAGSDDILVSRTVKDLVIGSDISFQDRGAHSLKGIEGDWDLYSVQTAS